MPCELVDVCETEGMADDMRITVVIAEAVTVLRAAGARFAYLHGSRAAGRHRPDSDIDVAAFFRAQPPNSFDVVLPPRVDLLVLDTAPSNSRARWL